MKELLEFIVSSLIDKEHFEIKLEVEGDNIRFVLRVDAEYIGLIIGKGGKTIHSLRNILRIKAVLEEKGVFLEVVEKDSSKKSKSKV